ncbi:hypothetical protein [Flavobacterium sp. UBA7680]|uniref:hypothetical protein n=1 Tax=Flavobacterium sp. UBA7680 TaxID=1946559 RepID=UPI0025C3F6BF|nr:hypothetical protein [Flavobacterium sp. UBA7680]
MKHFILALIFSGLSAYSQQKYIIEKDSIRFKNCNEGVVEAQTDFNNGIYNSFSYGLLIQIDPKFDEFLENYRKEKYGIISKNLGCVITEYSKCYSEKMDELIFIKFGKDIFERSRKEAKKIYKKS